MAQGPETKWATEVLLKEIADLRARLSAAEKERDIAVGNLRMAEGEARAAEARAKAAEHTGTLDK